MLFLYSCGEQSNEFNPLKSGFTINATTNLASIDLEDITEVNGGVSIIGTQIENVNFLSKIERINGKLFISGNAYLESLSGLENLQYVNSIHLDQNVNLENVNIISNLEIDDDLLILNNKISNIPTIERSTNFRSVTLKEERLINLNCLANAVQIRDELAIIDSQQIESLDQLSNILEIGSGLIVINNQKLNDFCGLKACLQNSTLDRYDVESNMSNPSVSQILDNCE